MTEITITGVIQPVNTVRMIRLPWWFGTSYSKILKHLHDKKGSKYGVSKKKNAPFFKGCSVLRRQLEYSQFYR